MNKPQNDKHTLDDQLADFTDWILEETNEDKAALSQEPELRALEHTVLNLKNAFQDDNPSEAVIQKMHQNILMEWKERERKASQSFWRKLLPGNKPDEKKWQSQRDHQHWTALKSLSVAAVVLLVSILLLNKTDFEQPAASGQNLNSGILAAATVLALLVLWIFRRKL
jgi:hypothetical protein